MKSDVRALQGGAPSILVATPGRLNDLLYNYDMTRVFLGLQVRRRL